MEEEHGTTQAVADTYKEAEGKSRNDDESYHSEVLRAVSIGL